MESLGSEIRNLNIKVDRLENYLVNLEERLRNATSYGRLICTSNILPTSGQTYNSVYNVSQLIWNFADGIQYPVDGGSSYLGWACFYNGVRGITPTQTQQLRLGFAITPLPTVIGYWLIGKVNGVAVDWIFLSSGPGVLTYFADPGQISHTKINFAPARSVLVRWAGREDLGSTVVTVRGGYQSAGLPAGCTIEIREAKV